MLCANMRSDEMYASEVNFGVEDEDHKKYSIFGFPIFIKAL